MLEIPSNISYKVNEKYWGIEIDLSNEDHLHREVVDGYILLRRLDHLQSGYQGEYLWQIFREDFEGFTIDIFNIASRAALRELRQQLVNQGVWIKAAKGSISYARVLVECLSEEEWTDERLKEAKPSSIPQPSQPSQPPLPPQIPQTDAPTKLAMTTLTNDPCLLITTKKEGCWLKNHPEKEDKEA